MNKANKIISGKFYSKITIGLLLSSLFAEYEQKIWESVLQQAEKNNINLLCFDGGSLQTKHTPPGKNTVYNLINTKRLDGLIVNSGCLSNNVLYKDFINFINKYNSIPLVSIGVKLKGTPSILIDNENGMYKLLKHLLEVHKYKKIAFIKGPENNLEAQIRFNVYKKVLAEHNISFKNEYVLEDDFSLIFNKNLNELVKRNIKSLDAIVCSNDHQAINIFKILKKNNYNVPNDIALTGFDNSSVSKSIFPALTTVNQSPDKLGKKAFKTLLSIIKNNKVNEDIILPTKLIIRRSCGCLNFYNNQIKKNNSKVKKNELNKNILFHLIYKKTNKILKYKKESSTADKITKLTAKLISCIQKNKVKSFIIDLDNFLTFLLDKKIKIYKIRSIIELIFHEINNILNSKNDIILLEKIWKEALLRIENIRETLHCRSKIKLTDQIFNIFLMNEPFISALGLKELKKIIEEKLPDTGIRSCFISLYSNSKNIQNFSKLFAAFDKNKNINFKQNFKQIKSNNLIPDELNLFKDRKSFYIRSLYFKEKQLGYIILEIGDLNGEAYENLCLQISVAIRSAKLIEKIQKHSKDLKLTVDEKTKELREANKKLRKLDKLKNDFIANITHDFRSPLTAILNIADLGLMEAENNNVNSKENYELIYNASLKLKHSIDRLLDLAKMDAQGIKLKIQKIKLINFLNKIIDFYTSSTIGSGIQIIKLFPNEEINNFYSDIEKLEIVINNIMSNAIKYINPKSGNIIIKLEEEKNFIKIIIADNGIGIPKDKLLVIFNRFEQVKEGRNSYYKGTGIGLAFAKQLIEYLKGEIWAESEGKDSGATFHIKLKKGKNFFNKNDFCEETVKDYKKQLINNKVLELKKILRTEIQTKLEKKKITAYLDDLKKEDEFNFKKSKILIVDDEENVRKIIMKYLNKNHYNNFITASNGQMAIEAVYQYKPHIIISDYNMPELKGDKFHDKLLSNPNFKNIPFIFLSAIADKSIIHERRRKGACAYLKKPIDPDELIFTVELHLKKHVEYLKTLKIASIDELTGLQNKRSLMEYLNHELSIRELRNLSIIFFDIDNFKSINDTYGHQVGDKTLNIIGKIVKSNIRNYDIPGRYGGDEFTIILPDTNINQSYIVAETLKKKIINKKIKYKECFFSITSSFGISSLIDNKKYICKKLKISNFDQIFNIENSNKTDLKKIESIKKEIANLLINMADTSLYSAKQSTCNNCGYTSEKINEFNKKECPECKSKDITLGRNKIVKFKE